MRRISRRLASLAAVVLLAGALAGCQFVDDLLSGQQITNERLGVDAALRGLTAELERLEGVESAEYGFDVADFLVPPGIRVELASDAFAVWGGVITRIEATAASDALEGYSITVGLEGPAVRADFDTDTGHGFDEITLHLAADAAAAFPGSLATVHGADEGFSIGLAVPQTAEELLTRLRDDAVVTGLHERAVAGGGYLLFVADGLEISAPPDAGFTRWADAVLAHDVPRMPTSLSMDPSGPPDEWVQLSYSSDGTRASLGVYWSSAQVPGSGGAVWDAFVAALRSERPVASDGTCVPLQISYGWRGAGRWPNLAANCGEALGASSPIGADELALLADALQAEGIDLEALGLELW